MKNRGLDPAGAEDLCKAGHTVLMEQGAGFGSGFSDESYIKVGAKVSLPIRKNYRSLGNDY